MSTHELWARDDPNRLANASAYPFVRLLLLALEGVVPMTSALSFPVQAEL
jgi:hypothetical protein